MFIHDSEARFRLFPRCLHPVDAAFFAGDHGKDCCDVRTQIEEIIVLPAGLFFADDVRLPLADRAGKVGIRVGLDGYLKAVVPPGEVQIPDAPVR